MSQGLLNSYLKSLSETAQQGDAREESFYSALEQMLQALANDTGRRHIRVTTLPKATEAGNPDFRLWNGSDRIIGYIEAKKPTEERLDTIENSEQLRRYRETFPNLILTNFLEFRLYRDGEPAGSALLARPLVFNTLHTTPPAEKPGELLALLDRFLDFSLPKAFTAESLAVDLAKRTRFMRNVVEQQLLEERQHPGALAGFYEAFQQYLIGGLSEEEFADLYAQTITYGLFAARTRAQNAFSRKAAFDNIPHTIGVLRDLFRYISLGDLPEQLAWCVDDISEVLAVADAHGILDNYYREGKGSDPIVHFYETFLAQYDPEERERRGVYYTPEPVVSYIVRSIHQLLKSEFGKADGLASDGVTLLDPAAGTMTFVARAAQEAVAEFESKYGTGAREDFIRRHILKNFYAFELMMAPYAVGHLKMSFFLEELGHRLADDERVPFYLTNTLDTAELEQSRLPGLSAMAEESRLAGAVKKKTPILVILGNPPYSGQSSNTGDWIRGLIEDYKEVNGAALGEKNPKWLQDDYVKFLRFAQWKIEQAGAGVAGMITNHGYIDNPTFRGMRRSLMHTFDEIHVLDLHGNARKRETTPDGGKDENVFDIQAGVAIVVMVKRGGKKKKPAVIRHAELWGMRQQKYDWLSKHDLKRTKWQELQPSAPSWFFIPRDVSLEKAYLQHPSITDIFPVNSVGIVTARDKLTVHYTAEDAWKTVTVFSKMDVETARSGYDLGRDAQDWQVELAQQDLRGSGPKRDYIIPLMYRPFDLRHTYYTGHSRGFICRPRTEVMRNMIAGENLALVTVRQLASLPWAHATVTDRVAESAVISNRTREIGYHFPLYIFPNGERDLFEHREPAERQPNLNAGIAGALKQAYSRQPAPESIFHYIYAVLYAPSYREKYAVFLRSDFPRVPFTASKKLFAKLAALGKRLAALHILRSPELDPPACRFEGTGDGRVSKGKDFRYDAGTQRVCINTTQHFTPVPREVWEYQIGGYQVCEKWLKDRGERRLSLEDVQTYCRIATAVKLTIDIQNEIDAVYTKAEEDTLQNLIAPAWE